MITGSRACTCVYLPIHHHHDQVGVSGPYRAYRADRENDEALVSQWLNSAVPAPEVAARAGHSVDVLLKIYAKCIDGQETEMNERIMRNLGEGQG